MNNTTWDILYHFLLTRVRYWVLSSHISVWRGQEEEIMADIVQEAISCTFLYTLKSYSWTTERDGLQWNLLKHLSMVIAYRQYQDLRRQNPQQDY